MDKKVLIIYFSGTGNTYGISELIRKKFNEKDILCDLVRIEDCQSIANDYDLIGIGYPVYGFICPYFVVRKIAELGLRGKDIFIFKTCANDHFLNTTSSYNLIKFLGKDNRVLRDYTFPVASNWLYSSPKDRVDSNMSVTNTRLENIVDELNSKDAYIKKIPTLRRVLLNSVGWLEEHFGATWWGRNLYMKSNCTKCGLCEKKCPTGNIKNLKFGWKCIWCMRCIYNCPEGAIKARFLNFVILKNGYNSKWLFK